MPASHWILFITATHVTSCHVVKSCPAHFNNSNNRIKPESESEIVDSFFFYFLLPATRTCTATDTTEQ